MATRVCRPPAIQYSGAGEWHWPRCAFQEGLVSESGEGQDCRIEMNSGEQLAGTLIHMNPVIGALRFQRHGDVRSVMLPFSRLFKLTLTSPVPMGIAPSGELESGTPTTVQTYDYRLVPAQEGRGVRAGRTAGSVQAVEGLYLFTPFHNVFSLPGAPVQVQRVFFPRSAYSAMEFGTAAQGIS